MLMKEWAKKEIEIAKKFEKDAYGKENIDKEEFYDYTWELYDSAYRAFSSLLEDGHSGFSIKLTQNILNSLIDGKPLTPIEDTEDIWNYVTYDSSQVLYQCKRASSLFKTVYNDGKIEYCDNDRFICIDILTKNKYYSGLITSIMHKIFPITMPYMFEGETLVYCKDYLTDPKNGDFDTKGIIYAIRPDGKNINISRYFKEGNNENGWNEIGIDEYNKRKILHFEREREFGKWLG